MIEAGEDALSIRLLLRVRLPGAIKLVELLDAVVARCDCVAAFLHNAIFGLNLFQVMYYFCREVGYFFGLRTGQFGAGSEFEVQKGDAPS